MLRFRTPKARRNQSARSAGFALFFIIETTCQNVPGESPRNRGKQREVILLLVAAGARVDPKWFDSEKVRFHADVLRFCRAELVADNYFHAVLEATKSIADKLRAKSGLTEDGAKLVDATLCGSAPRVAINDLLTDSQRSEQSGFANLVKGTFGMFRNPTAHEARVLWAMSKEDAEDLLSLASLIHRRLDAAR